MLCLEESAEITCEAGERVWCVGEVQSTSSHNRVKSHVHQKLRCAGTLGRKASEQTSGSTLENESMPKIWPYFTIAAASGVLALLLHAQKQPATTAPGNAARGKTYFQRDCAVCHTVGRGKQIGPDLLGVTRRRTHRWLVTMIQHPDQLVQRRDPIALALLKKYTMQMPDLHVSDAECADLIAYFEAESAAHEKAGSSK